ncbi:uncharacterized protein CANTADRAFT_29324, partial [Suhomyces tanzawaensis NRRL Y-17324]
FDSLVSKPQPAVNITTPATPSWVASLSWAMSANAVVPGDTFGLTMPCVFTFTNGNKTFDLQAEGKTYATCLLTAGEMSLSYSSVQCTVTNEINNGDVVDGIAYFPITFNVGGSSNPVDLECSTRFKPGMNTITFSDGKNSLSNTAIFNGGEEISRIVLVQEGNNLVLANETSHVRYLPQQGVYQGFEVSEDCGENESTCVEMGLFLNGGSLNCSSLNVFIAKPNEFNEWGFPTIARKVKYRLFFCTNQQVTLKVDQTPPGYRVYFDIQFKYPPVSRIGTRSFASTFCGLDNHYSTWGKTISSLKVGEAGSNGHILKNSSTTTVTSGWTGSFTTTVTRPGNGTNTVIVETPVPTTATTTVSSGWTGSLTTSVSRTGTDGTNTLIVETP